MSLTRAAFCLFPNNHNARSSCPQLKKRISNIHSSPRTNLGKSPRLRLHAEQLQEQQLHCSLICGRTDGLENSPLRSFTVQLRSSFIPAVPSKETKSCPEAPPGNLARVESRGWCVLPQRCSPALSDIPNTPTTLCRERFCRTSSVLLTFESPIDPGNAAMQDHSLCHVATKEKTGVWEKGKRHTDLPVPDLSGGRKKPPQQTLLFT